MRKSKTNSISVFYDGYRERNPVKWVKRWCKHWKWAYQRAVRGYADCDTWSIPSWFFDVMPAMLDQFAEDTHSFPLTADAETEHPPEHHVVVGIDLPDEDPAAVEYREQRAELWQNIIKNIAGKLREADEDTCCVKNPVLDDWHKMYDEFEKAYGLFGEKLETEEEKATHDGSHVMHFPSEVKPEWEDLMTRFREEEVKLDKYRKRCFVEAMDSFVKWFWDMWD